MCSGIWLHYPCGILWNSFGFRPGIPRGSFGGSSGILRRFLGDPSEVPRGFLGGSFGGSSGILRRFLGGSFGDSSLFLLVCHLRALLHSRYTLQFPTFSVFRSSSFFDLLRVVILPFQRLCFFCPLPFQILWLFLGVSLFLEASPFPNTAAQAPQLRPAQRTASSQPTSQHQAARPIAPPPQITILSRMLFSAWILAAFQLGVFFKVHIVISICFCWEIHDLLSPEWGCGDVVSGTSASPVGHVDGLPWPSR